MRKLTVVFFGLAISFATPMNLQAPAYAAAANLSVGSSLNHGRAITCAQGQRLLQNRGFRNLRRVDCRGRFFIYHGWLGSRRFEVALSSSTGRVVDLRRIR
jgi:hypothetical protein